MSARAVAGLVAVAIVAAACSADGSAPADRPDAATIDGLVRIDNRGDSVEGHTPRGFAGMGTGLFVGDNLNPGFPEGEGVQTFLTFDLPPDLAPPISATLTSDALEVTGSPFVDLGPLRAASVTYPAFGPEVFDTVPDSEPVTCERVGDTSISCDVTAAVVADLEAGATITQFQLRFDTPGDGDGRQDLAKFFITDSNTNEPGIFVLEVRS